MSEAPSVAGSQVRVLVVSGSSRTGSLNKRLAAVAEASVHEQGGVANALDLRALDLPVYDADLEAHGIPSGAFELRRQLAGHDALILSSPEYNAFMPPLVLNAFDWATRVPAGDGLPSGMEAMNRLVAGLLAASPGTLGGVRGLIVLRSFLQLNLGMLMVGPSFGLASAGQAFDDAGALVDPKQRAGLDRVVTQVLRTAGALKRVPPG